MTEVLLVSLFLTALYILLLLYYRYGWSRLKTSNTALANSKVFISVIIVARNEEAALPALLNSLNNQHYTVTDFEVIIIDDHSTDNTRKVIEDSGMANIKIIPLADYIGNEKNSFKKKGIETGILHAQGELIVTTDADCIVAPGWLNEIAGFYLKTKSPFIVMPVLMNYKNTLLEIFQSLDFMTLQGITAASAGNNLHIMCNGANLAYSKHMFLNVGGFEGINKVASGDDMLLMQKVLTKNPGSVHYYKSQNVIVETEAQHNFNDFINQRIRWASKSSSYNTNVLAVLILVYLFNLMMLIIPVLSLFINPEFSFTTFGFSVMEIWLLILLLKIIFEILFMYPVTVFFKKVSLLFYLPLLQPFHILYIIVTGFLGFFGRYEWKKRSVA